MSVITLLHNPNCSKSRQTLALLEERGAQVQIVEYLQNPPSTEELGQILSALEIGPRQLMRTKESVYLDLNLADTGLKDADLINAMIANPILIERPIAMKDGAAVIGRPPENVLALL
ncbi:MAG: arsenate reductase (glutaredoxin) [Pseudomonadota bacterium]|nr:arsenate reductase (glutaredoxin) [Pseudomonadota bacterium]